jgi:hypothetical protein
MNDPPLQPAGPQDSPDRAVGTDHHSHKRVGVAIERLNAVDAEKVHSREIHNQPVMACGGAGQRGNEFVDGADINVPFRDQAGRFVVLAQKDTQRGRHEMTLSVGVIPKTPVAPRGEGASWTTPSGAGCAG